MDSYLSKPVVQTLAAIGTIYVATKLFSYVRLLASLFLIPGVPVSVLTLKNLNSSDFLSSPNSGQRVVGQS